MTHTYKNFRFCAVCALAAVFALAALSSCFSPYKGEGGNLVIVLGEGASSRAFSSENVDRFLHTITVSGSGPEQSVEGIPYDQSVSFTVAPGTWTITVEAYLDGTLAARGSATQVINAGTNTVSITMTAVDIPDDPGGEDPGDADDLISIAAIPGVTPPAMGEHPVSAIIMTEQYTGNVTWSPAIPSDGRFAAETVYTASIELAVKQGFTLNGIQANFFTVAGAASVSNAEDSGLVQAEFPATGSVPPSVITLADITGITAPVRGEFPMAAIGETEQYTGTITWSPAIPSGGIFAAETVYTASIYVTPKQNFTLNGVPANFFAVAGAASVSNAENSGLVLAEFPATEAAQDPFSAAGLYSVTEDAEGIAIAYEHIETIAANEPAAAVSHVISVPGTYLLVLGSPDTPYTGPELAPQTLNPPSTAKLIIQGLGTEPSILSPASGVLFTLNADASLVLGNNITLKGRGNTGNSNHLVRINSGGKLVMENGSTITEGRSVNGGGVYMVAGGTFIMEGGSITHNTASGNPNVASGGGVYMEGGNFTMNNGTISLNIADTYSGTFSSALTSNGGGVYVGGGTFTMNNGTIYRNSSTSFTAANGTGVTANGGGVYVASGGTFTMNDGTISRNSASRSSVSPVITRTAKGGGVYVAAGGAFTKELGTIYGSDETDTTLANSALDGSAVFVNSDRYRNNTAGPEIEMNSSIAGEPGGWE